MSSAAVADHPRAGLLGAVRSEWTKLRTVPSTFWAAGAAVVLVVAGIVIASMSTRSQHASGAADPFSSSAPYVAGQVFDYLVQWAAVGLAVLMITSEFGNGSIRTTLQWIHSRGRLLAAKALVLVPVLLLLGAVLGALSIGAAVVGLGEYGEDFTAAYAVKVVFGIAVYLPMVGLFCLGVGTALRSAATTVCTAFVVLLILPSLLPSVGLGTVGAYMQGHAGSTLMKAVGDDYYGPGGAVVVALCWSAVALGAGYAALRRRDA
ncbi:ABC transporter permease [Amycolatopsis sp. QT-25]|uniref:ABC transporter permease n=1 Tax=Amycolatopsis sp. QT-25 TaxID=3034022 RepID=UPI0023EABA23|nr:ABC transporter permease [Amycolatopsis sp. QT-25]WET79033.1 ABC transporter permease [Amycolatopsis sp. QT-25]